MKTLEIYTDGGYRDDVGACAYVIINKKKEEHRKSYRKIATSDIKVTIDNMKLSAIISALKYVRFGYPLDKCIINIHTNSKYIQKGITNWISKWKLHNSLTSKNEKIKDKELWKLLIEEIKLIKGNKNYIYWKWIK